MIFCIFYEDNNLFLHQSSPSEINLIKNAKNHFLLLKKFKNTESAHLCNFKICHLDNHCRCVSA